MSEICGGTEFSKFCFLCFKIHEQNRNSKSTFGENPALFTSCKKCKHISSSKYQTHTKSHLRETKNNRN